MQWNEANIVVSEPRNEELSVWSFTGEGAFTLMMTAEPTKFSRTAMDDVDNDGELEIVALININVKKKKRSRTESKDGSDESDADYFVGGSWSVMSLAVGDVDETTRKEIVVTSGDRLAVFRFDEQAGQARLLAAREEVIEGARLNLWSVAIDKSEQSEKSQIYVSVYLVGRAEVSFLLILEMWDDWPMLGLFQSLPFVLEM